MKIEIEISGVLQFRLVEHIKLLDVPCERKICADGSGGGGGAN
jgi:hypothetical protein